MSMSRIVDAGGLAAALAGTEGAAAAPDSNARRRYRPVDLRSREAFEAGHLPGAVRLEAALLNRSEPPANGLLPSLEIVSRLAREIDLRENDHVIAYDAGGATEAARLLWVLETCGFARTSWLDGGYRAWQAADGEVESGPGEYEVPSDDAAPAALALGRGERVTADELLGELGDDDLRVLDVRGAAEYAGSDVRSAMGGHVPGAIHLEWTEQLDERGRTRPREALLGELAALDVRPEHRVVVYCQSHQRSSVTWLLLRELGFEDVRGLDGAWSVWGNDPSLPKETGPRGGR